MSLPSFRRAHQLVRLTALVAGLLAIPVAVRAAEVFVRFDGLEGASVARGFGGFARADRVSVSIANEGRPSDPPGEPVFGPLTLFKEFDRTTPELLAAVPQGRVFPVVLVEWVTRAGDEGYVFFRLTLEDAVVTRVDFVAGKEEGPAAGQLLEKVTVRYDRLYWQVLPTPTTLFRFGWDLVNNRAFEPIHRAGVEVTTDCLPSDKTLRTSCLIQIENLDLKHPTDITELSSQVGQGPLLPVSGCADVLQRSDGIAGRGQDHTFCTLNVVFEPALCAGGADTTETVAVFAGTADGDTVPPEAGGSKGVPQGVGNFTDVDVLCTQEFPTPEPIEDPTPVFLPTDTPQAPATVTPTGLAPRTATPTSTPEPPACIGDCDGSGAVTVDEIVRAVNIALGIDSVDSCPDADGDGNGQVTVDEILSGITKALTGCR